MWVEDGKRLGARFDGENGFELLGSDHEGHNPLGVLHLWLGPLELELTGDLDAV